MARDKIRGEFSRDDDDVEGHAQQRAPVRDGQQRLDDESDVEGHAIQRAPTRDVIQRNPER